MRELTMSRQEATNAERTVGSSTAVPRIRFKGCEGEWRISPFSEIVDRRTVAAYDEQLPCVEYEDIVSGENCLCAGFLDKIIRKKGLLFEEGDVLFGKLRPYLRNQLHANFKGIAVGDFWVLRGRSVDGRFLYALTLSDKFQSVANISSGSKMPRSDWRLVSTSKFQIPFAAKEQAYIGRIFHVIDDHISAQKARLISLRQLKQAMLVKMFPQCGKTVPEIRFKGFEGEWIYAPLKSYLRPSGLKNTELKYSREDVLSVSGDYGIVNQIKFKGRSFAGASVANYGVVSTGDVVYTKSPLNQTPYGIIKANSGDAGIVSTLYAVYKVNADVSPLFVETYFALDHRLNSYLRPLVRKGAKNDMKVSTEGALKGLVVFPSYKEQQKIGAFFKNLDSLIAAAEKRVAKLRQVKASLLEWMFV